MTITTSTPLFEAKKGKRKDAWHEKSVSSKATAGRRVLRYPLGVHYMFSPNFALLPLDSAKKKRHEKGNMRKKRDMTTISWYGEEKERHEEEEEASARCFLKIDRSQAKSIFFPSSLSSSCLHVSSPCILSLHQRLSKKRRRQKEIVGKDSTNTLPRET